MKTPKIKTEALFLIFSTIVFVIIVYGTIALENNFYLSFNKISSSVKYLTYLFPDLETPEIIFASGTLDSAVETTAIKYAKSVPVILYHSIVNKPDGNNVTLTEFKKQMFFLKKEGWQTVTMEDFYLFVSGKKSLPAKSFLLTFDDGTKNSFYPVDPILKILGYNAVSFIIVSHSIDNSKGDSFYLSLNELRHMVSEGRWEIGSHGKNSHSFVQTQIEKTASSTGHFLSHKLWPEKENRLETDNEYNDRIFIDLADAKSTIQDELDIFVLGFAFPYGDFGQNSQNYPDSNEVVLKNTRIVYPLAFYQDWAITNHKFNIPEKFPFMIKRIEVKTSWDETDLINSLGKEANPK